MKMVDKNGKCIQCHGRGVIPCPECAGGTRNPICPDCEGTGYVSEEEGIKEKCHRCNGTGELTPQTCSSCSGEGTIDCPTCQEI